MDLSRRGFLGKAALGVAVVPVVEIVRRSEAIAAMSEPTQPRQKEIAPDIRDAFAIQESGRMSDLPSQLREAGELVGKLAERVEKLERR